MNSVSSKKMFISILILAFLIVIPECFAEDKPIFNDGIGFYVFDKGETSFLYWPEFTGKGLVSSSQENRQTAYKSRIPVSKNVKLFSYGIDFSQLRIPPHLEGFGFDYFDDTWEQHGTWVVHFIPKSGYDQPVYEIVLPQEIVSELISGKHSYKMWGLHVGENRHYCFEFITEATMRNRTMEIMRALGRALGSYQIDNNMFPIAEKSTVGAITFKNNLADGLTQSYYDGSTKDAWGTDIYYHGSAEWGYTLKSWGKDKTEGSGTSEFDSDIVYINGCFVAPKAILEQ